MNQARDDFEARYTKYLTKDERWTVEYLCRFYDTYLTRKFWSVHLRTEQRRARNQDPFTPWQAERLFRHLEDFERIHALVDKVPQPEADWIEGATLRTLLADSLETCAKRMMREAKRLRCKRAE